MNNIREIIHRLQQGQSERQIAKDLRVSRLTVSKYRDVAKQEGYLDGKQTLPSTKELLEKLGPAKAPPCPESSVAPYRDLVERFLDDGVEKMAILARLRENHGYTGSYSSIWRFVKRLRPPVPEVCVRVHTGPGEEAQVDFGSVGLLLDPRQGRRRTAYAFVMTLCFSRHQYAELVFDQKISTWIACHRHAFESFGGIVQRVVPDNIKAAVLKASLHDPILGEVYRRMAQHYGFLISPTRPRTPEHKGKVESGVHYLKRNFMAGQEFADIDVGNRRLPVWVREVAGVRQHGTTRQPPLRLFTEREKAALGPLPLYPFSLCEVRPVKLHEDCHVVIDGSFYSAPWTYVGQDLEAYIHERVVEIYRGVELLTTHPRVKNKGEWQTRLEHYPPEKAAYLERTPERCRRIAETIGPATSQVVQTLLADRPLDRLRSVQGILRLVESVGRHRLEAACARALYYGDPGYRRIRDILNAALDQAPLPESSFPGRMGITPTGPIRQFTFARSAEEFFGAEGGER
jgi:transposase